MVKIERHIAAMEKINSLISVRERCCSEVSERLARAGFNEEEIEDAVESAVRCGLVSNERYARAYIRGKSNLGWGKGKILMHLRRDGIEEETIDACSDEFNSPDEEYQRALRELKKKTSRSSNPYASYMRRLVGKGYSYEVASRATKEFLSSHED